MKDSMRSFARTTVSRLQKRLARQMRRTAKRVDEETVHDLRVAMRRLGVCAREFSPLLPDRTTPKALKRLSKLMGLAADVRNRDIAITLIGSAHRDLASAFRAEREQATRKLSKALGRRRHIDFG